MRITGLNVENYGPFVGLPPMDLSTQLTIFAGPNEAGKSALRAFISMVLFGRRRSNAPDARWFNYSHAGGGAGRGSVEMESGGRNYTVHRREGSAPTVSDGDSTSGEELLNALIGRIDGALYQRVFSINLTELQDLNLLTDERVKGRIYSAGLGLGAVSLPDIKKAIEDERSTAGGLWSERKGRLRAGLEELATWTANLDLARSELHSYESLNGQITALSADISKAEGLRRDLDTERERLRRVEDLRAPWQALGQLRRQLENLPDTDAFPPDGVDQLDRLTARIESLSNTIRDGDLEQRRRDDQAEKLPLIESFELHDRAIRDVVDETVVYERLIRDLPGREQVRMEVESDLKTKLQELGPDWDESRVSTFADTAGARAEIRRAGRTLEAAKQQLDDARNAADSADREAEGRRRDLQLATVATEQLVDAPPYTVTEIQTRRGLLEQLRRANNDRESYARDMRDIETRAALPGTGRPVSLPRIMPAITALAGLALLAWGVTTNEISAIAGGGLALAATVALWFLTSRSGAQETSASGRPILDHLRELRALLEKSAVDTERLAEALGLESAPAGRDVQLALDEVGLDLEARREFDRRQEVVRLADEALQKAEAELHKLTGKYAVATAEAEADDERWRETLRRWTLDEGLDLTAANDLIAGVEQLNVVLARADTERQRVNGIEAEIDRIDRDLMAVMEATGSPVPPPRLGVAALNELKRTHEAERQARVELRTFGQLERDWAAAREAHEEQLDTLKRTRSNLMAGVGVESEDDFRRLGEARANRFIAEGQIRDRETDNPLLVSPEGEPYREDLAGLSSEEVIVRLGELGVEIETLDTSVLELHGDRRASQEKRRALEESNPVAELQSEITVLTEQVLADADRWAVLTIAGQLIEKASRRFQDQRQAPLLRSASGYFERMTIGEYASVQEVIGEDRLLVVHRSGATKDVTELSRGTVEQLFLALRFALIEEYCRNTEPMPVLLDDVLVNFDPVRARAAASAIIDLSQQHQVIALTCHPDTVAMFSEAAKAAGVEPPYVANLPSHMPELTAGRDPATFEQPVAPAPGDSPPAPADPAGSQRPRTRSLL